MINLSRVHLVRAETLIICTQNCCYVHFRSQSLLTQRLREVSHYVLQRLNLLNLWVYRDQSFIGISQISVKKKYIYMTSLFEITHSHITALWKSDDKKHTLFFHYSISLILPIFLRGISLECPIWCNTEGFLTCQIH